MGTDYKCGCRYSMGHWFLCDEHEALIIGSDDPQDLRHEAVVEKIQEETHKGDVVIILRPYKMGITTMKAITGRLRNGDRRF